jgi:hypothetical protein
MVVCDTRHTPPQKSIRFHLSFILPFIASAHWLELDATDECVRARSERVLQQVFDADRPKIMRCC